MRAKPGAICTYCGEARIAEQYMYSCEDCVFVCGTCKGLTPYELGGEGPDCDECWAKKN